SLVSDWSSDVCSSDLRASRSPPRQPATGVRVAGEAESAKLVDADLIVIGASPQLSLLDKWSEGLPAILQGRVKRVSAGSGRSEEIGRASGRGRWGGAG